MNAPCAREQGNALVIAIVVVALVGAFVVSFLTQATAETRFTRYSVERLLALQVAESGLADALHELNNRVDHGGDGIGNVTGQINGGTYTVTVTPPFDGSTTSYRLVCEADRGGARRTLEAVVVASSQFGAADGFFGANQILASGNVMVDSYDSSRGTYASQATNTHPQTGDTYANGDGDVGSNGVITVTDHARVFGRATPGPNESVQVSATAYVEDSTSPRPDPVQIVLDPYLAPTASPTPLSLSGTTRQTLTSGSYHYTSIMLLSRSQLRIDGDVVIHVDSSIDMTSQSEIRILPSASLEIHVGTGNVNIAGNGIVNETQLPMQCYLYHHGTTPVLMAGRSDFYGLVIAPRAAVSAMGSAQYFGALFGLTLALADDVKFHYDEYLRMLGGRPVFRSHMWREL